MRTHTDALQGDKLHDMQEDGSDWGNFFPRHHILIAFESQEQAGITHDALTRARVESVRSISDQEMISASQHGLDTAGLVAAMGSSLRMVELHNKLAREGCHFLLVKAESDDDTDRVMDIVRQRPFRLAQKYHRFIIQTLH